jgi:hypothetical protein
MIALGWLVFAITGVLMFGFTPPAGAQTKEMDHLVCYAAKDNVNTKADAAVTVEHFGTETGAGPGPRNCTVKGRAKLHCVRAVKDSGDDPRGPDPGTDYACFNLVCEDDLTDYNTSTDSQFGPHSFTVFGGRAKGKVLCAPTGVDLPSVVGP